MVQSKRVSVEELACAYRDVKQKLGSVVELLTHERATTRERDVQILDLRQALKKAIVKLSLSQSERSRYLLQVQELTEQRSAHREELERQHRAELGENASIQASILADLKREADAIIAAREQAILELRERLQQETEQRNQLQREVTELSATLEASRSEFQLLRQALRENSEDYLGQLAQNQQRLAELEADLGTANSSLRLERQCKADLEEKASRFAEFRNESLAAAVAKDQAHSAELGQSQQTIARQASLLAALERESKAAVAAINREHSEQMAQAQLKIAELEAKLAEQSRSHQDELLDLKSALEAPKPASTTPSSLDTESDSYYKGLESLRKFQAAARGRFNSSEERVSSG